MISTNKMELWTFAVRYITDQWNDTPRQELQMRTPNEVFENVSNNTNNKQSLGWSNKLKWAPKLD